MAKSNGIKSLKQAAKLLNKHAPDGESLAYINPEEAKLLRSHGGSGIMTLQGVPSYNILDWITETAIPWVGEKAGDIWENVTGAYEDKDVYRKGKLTTVPGRSIVQDAMSIWVGLRAKKEQEGLNAAEMEQFNKLNQQLAAAETEFDVSSDFGAQLKPEYETDITKSAAYTPIDFSGSATPDLTTTAVAHGGRIGAFNGGIQGLPQQGLNPRMGYALGSPDIQEEVVTDQMQDTEGQEAGLVGPALIQYRTLQKKVKGYVDGIGWVYGEPTEKEKRMYERLKKMMGEEEVYSISIGGVSVPAICIFSGMSTVSVTCSTSSPNRYPIRFSAPIP